MACKNTDVGYKLIDDSADVAEALAEIRSNDLLALDCEGVNLGRTGALTLLTIASPTKVYLFDVKQLGKAVFDDGLRDVLEDKTKEKLMFDCRRDADSLHHLFNVQLSGVLDIQLLDVMHRREAPLAGASTSTSGGVESVYGLLRCVELYIADKEMIDKKKKGQLQFECNKDIWKSRPLSDDLINYCCVDTSALFPLYEALKGDGKDLELRRLRVSSERYADVLRALPMRPPEMFENHALLPLYIIPDKGSGGFPFPTTKCVGCQRLFPRSDFSKTQLRKSVQKCRVCKEVKRRSDVQMNREANWSRDDHEYLYYSSSDNFDNYGYFGGNDSDNYGYYGGNDSDNYGYCGGDSDDGW